MKNARVLDAFTQRGRRGFKLAKRAAGAAAGVVRETWSAILAAVRAAPRNAAGAVELAVVAMLRRIPQVIHAELLKLAAWGFRSAAAVLARLATERKPVAVRPVDPAAVAVIVQPAEAIAERVRPVANRMNGIGSKVAAVVAGLLFFTRPGTPAAKAQDADRRAAAAVLNAIRPDFERAEHTARRVARTAGQLVVNDTVLATAARVLPPASPASQVAAGPAAAPPVPPQIGAAPTPELGGRYWGVVGFRVIGILDNRIRPAHRKRHGTAYYFDPRPGQFGIPQMPRPPYEADGTLAYNCRCILTPIFGWIYP